MIEGTDIDWKSPKLSLTYKPINHYINNTDRGTTLAKTHHDNYKTRSMNFIPTFPALVDNL